MKIRKWDTVMVIKWTKKVWKVLRAMPSQWKIVVEWVNLKTKYRKKTAQWAWEMVRTEFPIDASIAMFMCEQKKKPTRVWFTKSKSGQKIRISKLSWEAIDNKVTK